MILPYIGANIGWRDTRCKLATEDRDLRAEIANVEGTQESLVAIMLRMYPAGETIHGVPIRPLSN